MFFVMLISISILLGLGGFTPLYHLFYLIPPFNSIRYPVKFLFLFFFVIAVTSALGLDVLKDGVMKKEKK